MQEKKSSRGVHRRVVWTGLPFALFFFLSMLVSARQGEAWPVFFKGAIFACVLAQWAYEVGRGSKT